MSLKSTVDFIKKLIANKKSRDAYVYEHIRNGIPFQLRALREQRDWTQADLAKAAKTSRTTITRLENPNNDKLTLKTLLELASAFDVALLVKFVPFSRLIKEYEDVSSEALSAKSITDANEVGKLNEWAAQKEAAPIAAYANELPAVRLRVIEGRGNDTPIQPWLRFVHGVQQQSSRLGENLSGRQAQSESDEEAEAQDQPLTLAKAASGSGRR